MTDTDRTTDADREEPDAALAGYLPELREGIAYVRGSLLVVLLAGVVVAKFAAGAMLGVLPAFAAMVGGTNAYRFLMAAYAGGSLAGTLLASPGRPALGRFAAVGNVLSGSLLAWFPAIVGLLFLTFVPVGTFNVLFFTMLQSAVEDELLGRVSSVITSAASVAIPVGSVAGGVVAGVLGSRCHVLVGRRHRRLRPLRRRPSRAPVAPSRPKDHRRHAPRGRLRSGGR